MRSAKNGALIGWSGSNDQTRARICDCGEYAARATNAPAASTMSIVAPAAGLPSTRSIAPENIHGWRWTSDRSRPAFKRATGPVRIAWTSALRDVVATARAPRARVKRADSADDRAEQVTEHVRHAACQATEREHSRARINGVPSGEKRQCRAHTEQARGRQTDRPAERVRAAAGEPWQERHERACRECTERARGGTKRRSELARIESKLLARQRVEGVFRIGHEPLREPIRLLCGQSFCRIDQRELLRLGFRILLQLVALERDLVLIELALRLH